MNKIAIRKFMDRVCKSNLSTYDKMVTAELCGYIVATHDSRDDSRKDISTGEEEI